MLDAAINQKKVEIYVSISPCKECNPCKECKKPEINRWLSGITIPALDK